MYKVLFAVVVFFFSISAHAGLFGPSDPQECMVKHQKKVRLEDARSLLRFTCGMGYGGNVNPVAEKAGRCIASEAREFYSFESALKVINRCTKNIENGGAFFNLFRKKLYEDMDDAIEASQQRQRNAEFDRERSSSSGPITIYDSATGTYKYCHKSGGVLSCF